MNFVLYCDTGLLRIAYLKGGPVDGAPAILLHGWPDDATTYSRILPALPGRLPDVFTLVAGVRTDVLPVARDHALR
jgi:pimeloyl-ACP methyl ester carboxylesterase